MLEEEASNPYSLASIIIVRMTRNTFISIFGVLALLILITTGIFLYAQGYRLDFRQRTLTATGIILAKSLPEGAQVYLDGELTTATNSTLSGVKPGTYQVKIERDGYFPWEKNIEVKAGLVTEIIALLPPLSPSLTAVTQEGARLVTSAPSGVKAAFLSKNKLYLLSLTDQLFGFLRPKPSTIQQSSRQPGEKRSMTRKPKGSSSLGFPRN